MRSNDCKISILCVCLIVCCLGLGSCRVSRHINERVNEVSHIDSVAVTRVDTVRVIERVAVMERDTVKLDARNQGSMDIRRDSTGRPVSITWDLSLGLSGLKGIDLESTGLYNARCFAAEDSCATTIDADRAKKVESETKAGAQVDDFIAAVTVSLIVLYLIYIFLHDIFLPWYRKRQNR
ncbi:MAG: hypothetical protein J6C44_10065 [Muribaculaceae bacterium]|nr:hypothetical protein [Muribaculaceae bacterium]